MAGYAVKACTDKSYRRKSGIIILLVALLSCIGTVLCVYNLVTARFLFAASYFIAIILGFTYVIIKYNTVYSTYAATDTHSVYMRNWTNGFFPYDSNHPISILSEFIPAKTILTEVPINDISIVVIGTKNFIKRHCSLKDEFAERLEEIGAARKSAKAKAVMGMELLYIETESGECAFMPIMNFSKRNVIKLIQLVQRKNPRVEVKVNSRGYRAVMSGNR